jgi:THO complex subunit 4
MLVSAANLPPPARQPSLAERVTYVHACHLVHHSLTIYSQPRKDKPKPATAEKAVAGRGRGDARGKGRGGRGGRERQKKKTTEDLDAEMADYFTNTDGAATAMDTNGAGTAQATAGGDIAMGEEML